MRPLRALPIAMLGVGAMLHGDDALANAGLGGRFWLTYQKAADPMVQQEYFIQHYEATLRDRLFQQNNMALTFYFDNSKELQEDLTYRRYRLNLDLSHRYYTFNARYTPLQVVTPLELSASREARRNQLALDIHVPKAPVLRFSYDTRTQYADDQLAIDIRDVRGDARYRYRFLDLQLNRLNSTSGAGNTLQTDVTGAVVRVSPEFNEWLLTSAGYEYRLTETDRVVGPLNQVTNQTVTGLLGARWRRDASAVLALSTRRLSIEDVVDTEGRDDNANFVLSFFENRHVRPEASHTYILTEQNGAKIVSNYASLQVLADGEIRNGTWGRAQLTQRFDVDTQGGVLPTNIYMGSVRSRLYRGVDLRVELIANEALYDSPTTDQFQTSSLFDLYLAPLTNFTLTPHVQYTKASDELSFVHNDRAMSGITINYLPAYPRMTIGMDASRTNYTTGQLREDTAATANVSIMLRERSTVSFSYGIRKTEHDLAGSATPALSLVDQADTFNAQAQIWVARKASLSINYTNVNRDSVGDSDQLAVTYRQDL